MQNSNRIIAGRVLKVAIVLIAALLLFFALRKFFLDENAMQQFTVLAAEHWPWLALVAALLPLNWFLETAKWKRLISASEKISWKEAWSAVLAGLAIGAATPNRVGEFAGRIFQLKSTPLRDGIVFTLVSSFMQVLVTVAFGFIGLLMTDPDKYFHSTKAFVWTVVVTGAASIAIGVLKSSRGKIADYFSALRKIDGTIQRDVFLLSALRYVVYTIQFLLMLKICGVDAPVWTLLCAIAVNYLVVTIIPSVIFSEMIVRGTVATGVIGGLCGNPGAAALAAVLLWMINVALPAASGLFFVRNITFFRKK
jgi:uncharacterized membrane protein YbhN (UPF0104 family)